MNEAADTAAANPQPYTLAMCAIEPRSVFAQDGNLRPEALATNVEHLCDDITRAAGDHGARLIVFPQFALSGYAMLTSAQWAAAGITFPGPETERIGAAARAAGAHVVIQAAERHAAFPGRYFLSAAILKPDGDIGLVYRKHYTLSLRTSPIDVFDRFVAVFGPDAFFPVLDTQLGRLGLAIGAEPHFPEGIRSLALKGAEVVLNPVAAAPLIDYLDRPGAEHVRAVRAFENMVYFGMANVANPNAPPSAIHDYHGRLIGAPAGTGGKFTLATVDIRALRAARAAPAANFLAQIQPGIHEHRHQLVLWPSNAWRDAPATGADDLTGLETSIWNRLQQHWPTDCAGFCRESGGSAFKSP